MMSLSISSKKIIIKQKVVETAPFRRFRSSILRDRIIRTLNNEIIMVVSPRRRQRGSSSLQLENTSEREREREEIFGLTTECRAEFAVQKSLCASYVPPSSHAQVNHVADQHLR